MSASDSSSSPTRSPNSSSPSGSSHYHNRIIRSGSTRPVGTSRSSSSIRRPEDQDSGITTASANPSGASALRDPRDMSYSQRIARLRKPALTAADKLAVKPEERARILQLLRTPRRRVVFPSGSNGFGRQGRVANTRFPLRPGLSHGVGQGVEPRALLPLPLRVFCYGIDDVRLYRALEPADALGLVVLVPDVESADTVWATRVKRTGKALSLKEISNAARNANKPFVELSAVSAVRVMEAVEALTGWPVPEHLLRRNPPPLVFLPPLDEDPTGSVEALKLLTGGRSLPEYIQCQAGSSLPAPLLRELDRTDLYDNREELLPVNPQEREAARQRPVSRPYIERSRQTRQQLLKEQLQRRAEAEGIVPW
ncbi:hypothetical protein VaNZ11_013657 [Volvox africanus]|uniref:Uncharacterized protein n=1 Tax=Volvox africanus TaxID=51714 RepID=A0ABQ5SHV8_9CHLO|nr:hypothetical protein VaNZ11_013657 [Volvox africanus]